MGSPNRTSTENRESVLRTKRKEVQRQERSGVLSNRESNYSRKTASRHSSVKNECRCGIKKRNAFFCPQCGFPIVQFIADVSSVGYRMEALCPSCGGNVAATVETQFITT